MVSTESSLFTCTNTLLCSVDSREQRSTKRPAPNRTHSPYTFPCPQLSELFPHRSWLGPILASRTPRHMKKEPAVGTAEHTSPFFLCALCSSGRLPRCNVVTYLCAFKFGRAKWAIIRTAAMASQTSTSEQSSLETPPPPPAREKVQ